MVVVSLPPALSLPPSPGVSPSPEPPVSPQALRTSAATAMVDALIMNLRFIAFSLLVVVRARSGRGRGAIGVGRRHRCGQLHRGGGPVRPRDLRVGRCEVDRGRVARGRVGGGDRKSVV